MGSCRLGNCISGKLPLGKWSLGKLPLGKYLTPKGTVDVIFFTMNELINLILVGMSSSDRFFTLSPSKLKHYLFVVELNVSIMHNNDLDKFFLLI